MADKTADLAGPGIGNYEDLAADLPDDYSSALSHRETMEALFAVKTYIEENLCRELGLMMVQVPLIVDEASGVNDYLDRDGSRGPVEFHISNDHDVHPGALARSRGHPSPGEAGRRSSARPPSGGRG